MAVVLVALVATAIVFFGSTGDREVNRPTDWFSVAPGVAREQITIDSSAINRQIDTAVLLPPGFDRQDRRPLLVMLHGRGTRERHLYDNALIKALAAAGENAPVVALPYGGGHSYWHDRRGGAWGRYVVDEVIPTIAKRYGIDRRRVAIGGVSMGGFGAFDLARQYPRQFCAAGGHSPALWQTGGESAAGAFDDAADFSRHDVIAAARARPSPYAGIKIWLDAGDADPFAPGVSAMRTALEGAGVTVSAHTWRGGHDYSYWQRHYAAYLRFYTQVLAHCR